MHFDAVSMSMFWNPKAKPGSWYKSTEHTTQRLGAQSLDRVGVFYIAWSIGK